MTYVVPDVPTADLVVGAVYQGETTKRNEPISRLTGPGVANSRGFRKCYKTHAPKSSRGRRSELSGIAFIAIYSSGSDKDWPDRFDDASGTFTYFGDNKRPGHALHDTDKGGNWLLRDMWDGLSTGSLDRRDVPPMFVFRGAGRGHDVEFIGLAVPGARGLPLDDTLVALWRSTGGRPFQNYRATLTVLETGMVARGWLDDLRAGRPLTNNTPKEWKRWMASGKYQPRITLPTVQHRTVEQQKPQTLEQARIIRQIRAHYRDDPYGFERFAAALVVMMEPGRVVDISVTRPRVDGGRDAIGKYRIGFGSDPVDAEFAVEAKCTESGIGVKDIARLLSRIRFRQFGVFVTTSHVSPQAYKEIKEDAHPIAILSGRDIAETLLRVGYGDEAKLQELLDSTGDVSADLVGAYTPMAQQAPAKTDAAEDRSGYGD